MTETVFISETDQYLFAQGTHYDIYKKLGAHLSVEDVLFKFVESGEMGGKVCGRWEKVCIFCRMGTKCG